MKTELEILNEIANRYTLFYVPHELFPNFTDEQIKQGEGELFFGRLYLYKHDYIIVDINKGLNSINLLSKKNLLENNILRLIEVNEKGKKESFNFLLEKYVSRIKGWKHIYEWLNNNVDNNIVDVSISEKNLLQFQLDITKNHFRDIESRFGKRDNVSPEQAETMFLENNDFVVANGKSVHDIIKDKKETSELTLKSKSRQLLITNEDADSYLLETIFNVDNIYH